mmetsp:Transcript_7336/g.17740  ORF Transcript_7336/g.17740 Transcript_7336/m.17740 type:complete len:264 (+) Transcript_7336:1038-1829(+)
MQNTACGVEATSMLVAPALAFLAWLRVPYPKGGVRMTGWAIKWRNARVRRTSAQASVNTVTATRVHPTFFVAGALRHRPACRWASAVPSLASAWRVGFRQVLATRISSLPSSARESAVPSSPSCAVTSSFGFTDALARLQSLPLRSIPLPPTHRPSSPTCTLFRTSHLLPLQVRMLCFHTISSRQRSATLQMRTREAAVYASETIQRAMTCVCCLAFTCSTRAALITGSPSVSSAPSARCLSKTFLGEPCTPAKSFSRQRGSF